MTLITSLSVNKKNKNRCDIFFDNEFFMTVSLEIVYKYSLKAGKEINKDKLDEIIKVALKDEALSKTLNYISKYSKTKKQIFEYLQKKEYPFEVIDFVIDKLETNSFIDDLDFAKKYIELYSKKQGKKLLAYNLTLKGVSKSTIEEAFRVSDVDYRETATIIAEKYLKNKEKNFTNCQKAFRYLIAKGFSYEEVESAISELKNIE